MNDFTMKDIQLIAFLCMQRKHIVGLNECEQDGTADLYRKACSQLRENEDE